MNDSWKRRVAQRRGDTIAAFRGFTHEHDEQVVAAATLLREAVLSDRTIFVCGNGGSAADAQHFAAELVGRYQDDRPSFGAVALTTNTSSLTAISNDYGFERVFARQISGLGRQGDLLVVISTSGNSPNVLEAAREATMGGMKVIGMTGEDGGELKGLCDITMAMPSKTTAQVQELHIHVLHTLCELIELE